MRFTTLIGVLALVGCTTAPSQTGYRSIRKVSDINLCSAIGGHAYIPFTGAQMLKEIDRRKLMTDFEKRAAARGKPLVGMSRCTAFAAFGIQGAYVKQITDFEYKKTLFGNKKVAVGHIDRFHCQPHHRTTPLDLPYCPTTEVHSRKGWITKIAPYQPEDE